MNGEEYRFLDVLHQAGESSDFAGDPYGEDSAGGVYRSVKFPSPEDLGGHGFSKEGFLYDEEEEHTTRGVTLAAPPGGGPGFEDYLGVSTKGEFASKDYYAAQDAPPPMLSLFFDDDEEDDDLPPPPPPDWACSDLVFDAGDCCSPSEDFTADNVPPSKPQSEFFEFLPTTLHLKTKHAYRLGNDLVDFYQRNLKAKAPKVRPNKYTIKKEVVTTHGEATCTVKMRVYRMKEGTYAVEVQRRQGDVVFFMNIYRQLAKYLSENNHELESKA